MEQLRLLAFGTERQWYNSGVELFHDGETSDGGYIVASGQIDLVTWRDDRQIILDSCKEAALIGEMALLTQNRRTGTAIARVDSEVMFVPRSLFHRMLREYPEMAAMLHQRISENVRMMMRDFDVVSGRMAHIGALEAMPGGRRNPHRIKLESTAEQVAIEHQPAHSSADNGEEDENSQ